MVLPPDRRQPVLVLLGLRNAGVTPEALDVAFLRPPLLPGHPRPLNPLHVVRGPRVAADALFSEPAASVLDAPDPVGPPLVDQLQEFSFAKAGHQLLRDLVPLPARGFV